ncbi:MAG: hypothetical protein PF482_06590 [Desulfobacteraceae bacterium]|jgi:hypothetical protein|nr:hypothetical protein [Desulfobacteraceae bacterium]
MKNEKASLLAKSEDDFNAWMTQTTNDMDTYKNRLETEEVYASGWPCWQLIFAVNNLREYINSEYRTGVPTELYYWQVQGQAKTSDGVGAAGMDIVLDGCYWKDCTDSRLSFPTTTGIDRSFVFELVSTGNFTIKASGEAESFICYRILPESFKTIRIFFSLLEGFWNKKRNICTESCVADNCLSGRSKTATQFKRKLFLLI